MDVMGHHGSSQPSDVDIRDITSIQPAHIQALNFIRNNPDRIYRKHHRQGLRSHVVEVLRAEDVATETRGIVMDGVKWFPRARPIRILRIFRKRFTSSNEAFHEAKRVKLMETWLTPSFVACSQEFIVDYIHRHTRDILLCGYQEYVDGVILNPWDASLTRTIRQCFAHNRDAAPSATCPDPRFHDFLITAGQFVDRVKQMIHHTGHIPDLAGIGNLLVTVDGRLKLVDINNLSPIRTNGPVHLDDKHYPACDKSVEALYNLETQLLGRSVDPTDPLYRVFLDPERKHQVALLDRAFHRRLALRRSQGRR